MIGRGFLQYGAKSVRDKREADGEKQENEITQCDSHKDPTTANRNRKENLRDFDFILNNISKNYDLQVELKNMRSKLNASDRHRSSQLKMINKLFHPSIVIVFRFAKSILFLSIIIMYRFYITIYNGRLLSWLGRMDSLDLKKIKWNDFN